MDKTPLQIAYAWIDAVNREDGDRLMQLSSQEIEIKGPRGSVRGSDILRDWLARAGARFENRRVFRRGGTVVVEQRGIWQSAESGAVVGEAAVASRFEVQDGRVIEYQRFDDLSAALAAGSSAA
jgi:limonene-1,2-epoxide hydrolase